MPDPILHGEGATSEDEYFHKINQKAIEEKRKALDTKRAEEMKKQKKNTHWMKCPKCGHDLQEIDLKGIKVDQCLEEDCGGVYFDKGELELLLEIEGSSSEGLLGKVRKLFS